MIHSLKIEQQYMERLADYTKKSEIRYNDRDYQIGDMLRFWREKDDTYYFYKITHIHSGLGMKEGYVVLSLEFQHIELG